MELRIKILVRIILINGKRLIACLLETPNKKDGKRFYPSMIMNSEHGHPKQLHEKLATEHEIDGTWLSLKTTSVIEICE
jgi:hypothetical protein